MRFRSWNVPFEFEIVLSWCRFCLMAVFTERDDHLMFKCGQLWITLNICLCIYVCEVPFIRTHNSLAVVSCSQMPTFTTDPYIRHSSSILNLIHIAQ